MDALTAGTALVAVQLCLALVMAGTFYAAPSEKCTRYWALSGLVVAVGVLMIVANAGAPRYAILIIGNNCMIAGLILQWWGVQAFYKAPASRIGWFLLAAFFLIFEALLMANASVVYRALLSSVATMTVFVLNFGSVWRGQAGRRTFASVLALAALAQLIASFAFRSAATLLQNPAYLPTTTAPLGIAVVYLVPLAGTLLFSTALLLLYFEKMVGDKNHLATHDELTGMLNRRAINAGGEREVKVALRSHKPLAAAYIDIDFFKKINDLLGHEAGDAVLVDIARLLKQTCRDIDLVGRYGGEEFCIVLPGVDRAGAVTVGERLLAAVREYRFRNEHQVTISIGFAVIGADSDDLRWNNLMHRADSELYQAKTLGRNRFCIKA